MYSTSFAYTLLLAAIWLVERRRTESSGPDLLSLLWVFFSVQLVVPGIFITMILAVRGAPPETSVPLFDHVYSKLSLLEPAITLVCSAWWVLSLYAGWLISHEVLEHRLAPVPGGGKKLSCSPWRWTLVMLVGLLGMWKLMTLLGGSIIESYQNLILFRSDSDEIEKNFLRANLFSSAQTFSLVSIIGLYVSGEPRSRGVRRLFAISCMAVFGLMCASRRAFAIQAISVYFVFVLMHRRWYFYRFIVPATALFFPVIVFGKEFLSRLAIVDWNEINLSDIVDKDFFTSILSGMSYAGISLVSSWATLLDLDIPFRFGVDHLFSVLQRIPVGFLFGWDKSWLPERIVRVSTDKFAGAFEQDIPPGLIGQMWLDFGYLGPIFWGLIFGLQIGFAQLLFKRYVRTSEVTVLSVLTLFVIALPINTGSFDFTFSADIFLFFLLLAFIYRTDAPS